MKENKYGETCGERYGGKRYGAKKGYGGKIYGAKRYGGKRYEKRHGGSFKKGERFGGNFANAVCMPPQKIIVGCADLQHHGVR